jgi:hypothetical protein
MKEQTVTNISIVDSYLSGIQASRINIQQARTSKRICHFYKVIEKQISDMHMFICHMIVQSPPAALLMSSSTVAITIEAN